MPAVSKKQRVAIAIAEHNPGKLYKRNSGLRAMSQQQLHDFTSTSARGLPVKKPVKPSAINSVFARRRRGQ